jgi:hypothetical protein
MSHHKHVYKTFKPSPTKTPYLLRLMLTSFGAPEERAKHGQLRNLERGAPERELQKRAECLGDREKRALD